jgi:hypothetical protein
MPVDGSSPITQVSKDDNVSNPTWNRNQQPPVAAKQEKKKNKNGFLSSFFCCFVTAPEESQNAKKQYTEVVKSPETVQYLLPPQKGNIIGKKNPSSRLRRDPCSQLL